MELHQRMAGKRQHYIPQFFLKHFSVPESDPARLFLFRPGVEAKSVATKHLAVQDYFYSRTNELLDVTLDDEITNYENDKLSAEHSTLLSAEFGDVDSSLASSFAVHLAVRARFLRDAFYLAVKRLSTEFSDSVRDPNWLPEVMGSADDPDSLLSKAFDEQMKESGLDLLFADRKDEIKEKVGEFLGSVFKDRHSQISDDLRAGMETIQDSARGKIADKHQEVLGQDLAPEDRMRALEKLTWQKHKLSKSVILPDCVVVSQSSDGNDLAYILAGTDFHLVILPISDSQILVGSDDGECRWDVGELNSIFASASIAAFFASSDCPTGGSLGEKIGDAVNRVLDDAVKDTGYFGM